MRGVPVVENVLHADVFRLTRKGGNVVNLVADQRARARTLSGLNCRQFISHAVLPEFLAGRKYRISGLLPTAGDECLSRPGAEQ